MCEKTPTRPIPSISVGAAVLCEDQKDLHRLQRRKRLLRARHLCRTSSHLQAQLRMAIRKHFHGRDCNRRNPLGTHLAVRADRFIAEFGMDIEVVAVNAEDTRQHSLLEHSSELLPDAFSSSTTRWVLIKRLF